jgi:hypothetical protein
MLVDGHMHLNGTLQDPVRYPKLVSLGDLKLVYFGA